MSAKCESEGDKKYWEETANGLWAGSPGGSVCPTQVGRRGDRHRRNTLTLTHVKGIFRRQFQGLRSQSGFKKLGYPNEMSVLSEHDELTAQPSALSSKAPVTPTCTGWRCGKAGAESGPLIALPPEPGTQHSRPQRNLCGMKK